MALRSSTQVSSFLCRSRHPHVELGTSLQLRRFYNSNNFTSKTDNLFSVAKNRTFSTAGTSTQKATTSSSSDSWSHAQANPHVDLEGKDSSEWGPEEKLAFFFKTVTQSSISVEDAEAVFVQMGQAGITPDVTIYTAIINVCIKHEEFDRAEKWFQRMKEMDIPLNDFTYGCMISLGGKVNDADLTEHYWEEYLNSKLPIMDKMFSILINALAKAHAKDRAVHWFREAASTVGELNPSHLQGALKGIANSSRKAGSGELAEELAAVLINKGVKLDNLCRNYMIRIWGRERNLPKLRKWFEGEDCSEEPNSYTYAITVQAMCEAGDFDNAEVIAMQMDDAIGTNGVVCNTLITMAGKKGDYELAKKWATRRLEAQFEHDGFTYFGLMLGAAHAGHIDEMVGILEKIPNPTEKHLSFAILELAKRRDMRALDYELQLKLMGGNLTRAATPLLKALREEDSSA